LKILPYNGSAGIDRSRRPGVDCNDQELTNDVH
jgi:hypothetical protein